MPAVAPRAVALGSRLFVIAVATCALGVIVAVRASERPAASGRAAVSAERLASDRSSPATSGRDAAGPGEAATPGHIASTTSRAA